MNSPSRPGRASSWLDLVESEASGLATDYRGHSPGATQHASTRRELRHADTRWSWLRSSMVRNSLYLILTSGLQAFVGFVFWVVAARLFTADQTGQASSLVSATLVIALIALLGGNNSFIRYLPGAKDKDALITGGLAVVTMCALALSALYVVAIPTMAPRLAFVEQRLPFAIGFIVFTAAASMNLLTDSIFIGTHRAGYVALTDGAIAGTVKIVGLVLLVGGGAFGLYAASSTGLAASALVSVVLIAVFLKWRPKFRGSLTALRPLARFSAANYATGLLSLIPQSVLPIILIDRLGPSAAAYYYVSYQVANLAYSTIYAVQSPLLAEGSRGDVDLRELVKRSVRLTLIVSVPVAFVVILAAHWILLVFGTGYSAHGTLALIVLAATTLPLAAIGLLNTVLRLLERLQVLVWSSVLYAVVVCTLAWFLAPHGIAAVAASWPISVSLAGVPCVLSLLRRRPVALRRRRADRIDLAVAGSYPSKAGVQADRNFADGQQAGLAALLSLAATGNTAPIAFGMGVFDTSPVPLVRERESVSSRREPTQARHRHRSGANSEGGHRAGNSDGGHRARHTSPRDARRRP